CGISQPIPPAPGTSGFFPANDTEPTFLKVPNPPYIKQEAGTVGGESIIHGGTVTPPVNYSQDHHYGPNGGYGEPSDTEKPSLFYRKPFDMPYMSNPYMQPHSQQFSQHPHPHLPAQANHHHLPHHHQQLHHNQQIAHLHHQHHHPQQLPPLPPTVPTDMHSPQQHEPEHLQRLQQQQQQLHLHQPHQHPSSFHEYFDHLDPSSMEPYAYVLQKPFPPPQPLQPSETTSPMPTSFSLATPAAATPAAPYDACEPPTEKGRFKCETCPKTFDTKGKLEKHNRTHLAIGGTANSFKCERCHKTFNQKCQLQYHEKLQEEHTIACDHCEKVFCYKASHKEHMFKVHFPRPKKESHRKRVGEQPGEPSDNSATAGGNGNQGRNKFKCSVCDRRFYYKRALEMHMGVHDSSLDVNVLYFSCSYCPDTFTEEEALQQHEAQHVADGTTDFLQNMKSLEQSENPANGQVDGGYRCPLCFKRFEDQQTLREHHRTHLCPFPDCSRCVLARSDEFDLTRSTYDRTEDAQPTVCNVCHRVLPTFEAYQNHFHYHTSRVPFYCYHCREEFNDKRELYNHTRTHTPREPESYTCEVCAKVFSTKGNFKRHLKSHEAVRAFACDRCSKQYDYKSALEVHLKRSHGIEL
uniref:C2H2-type domain-containing protein n=1 Tax=Anopheles christyi TaxID=43041 RepID=A0A182JZA5_9DIPT